MSTTARIGRPPQERPTAMFPHTPTLGEAFGELYGTLWRGGLLEQELKETVRIRNARLTDCGL